MSDAPKRIVAYWVGDPSFDAIRSWHDFADNDLDEIDPDDTEYVRADILRAQSARIEELEAALRPFADYMHTEGGRLDADNKGIPLPDEQSVGWIYLTNSDFRTARAALGDTNG